jgi:hypothetical protein
LSDTNVSEAHPWAQMSEDGGSMFLQNDGIYLKDHTALLPSRQVQSLIDPVHMTSKTIIKTCEGEESFKRSIEEASFCLVSRLYVSSITARTHNILLLKQPAFLTNSPDIQGRTEVVIIKLF